MRKIKKVKIENKEYICDFRFDRIAILIEKDSIVINNLINYFKNKIHTFTFDQEHYEYITLPNKSTIDYFENTSYSELFCEIRISGLKKCRINTGDRIKCIREYNLKEIRTNY